ncbi:MAG: tetratricopeptide repeat protein [Planctomycetota bacterium]
MADSLGTLDLERIPAIPDDSWLQNARSGYAYRVQEDADDRWSLQAYRPPPAQGWPGFERDLPIGFRIGAGVHAMSFVTQEQERWNFAPIEYYTGVGWEAAPQELGNAPAGLHHGITGECVSCHSDDAPPETYPLHALGGFQPSPIGCVTCHGPGERHVALMEKEEVFGDDLQILYPGDWAPTAQVDLCARCHLEGDARIEFQPWLPHPRPGDSLAEARAVMVAKRPSEDFSFVSQVRRMALSACFQQSPEMTCTTCHDPHLPPRLQTQERRNRACLDCHADISAHGDPRPEDDCISCHMPRRRPYDLPGVRISDHLIGIHPTDPTTVEQGFRHVESATGDWELFHYRDGDPHGYTAGDLRALEAMTLAEKGYPQRAMPLFDGFPAPGTLDARPPRMQTGRPPVLRLAQFHFLRGRTLTAAERPQEAMEAYRDALALQPDLTEASLNLAWLLAETDALDQAETLARQVAEQHPLSEAPWNILFLLASKRDDPEALHLAAKTSLERQPDQPRLLQALGRIYFGSGQMEQARVHFAAAFALDPDLPGLIEDIGSVGAALR